MSVVSSSAPPAATALPIVVTSVLLIVCVGLTICGTPCVKDIDANFVVRRDFPLSASFKFKNVGTTHEQRNKQNRELDFFYDFGLLLGGGG